MTIRAPFFVKRPEIKRQQRHAVPNLLITTLAVVATAPFAQLDWPNPQPAAPAQQPVQISAPLALIETAGEKPFAFYDWPNPRPSGLYETLRRGQSIIEIGGDPFLQTDWPNPRLAVQVQQPFQVGSSLTLIETAGEKPFAFYDWQNPAPLAGKQPEQVGQYIGLEEVVAAPFAQSDWPNPARLLLPQQPYQVGSPLALIETAGEKPFAQPDWITPPAAPTQQPLQIGKPIVLVDVVVKPFAQHVWPNPKTTGMYELLSASQSITEVISAAPFAQTDWPNPALEVLIQQPFQVGSSLTLIETAGEKPFAQLDWITPPEDPQQEPRQIGKSIALDVEGPKPFAQYDWPNASVAVLVQQPSQISAPLALIEDAGEKPFAQTDWITPPPSPTVQLEQISKSVALVETVAGVPFAQFDWPNYRQSWLPQLFHRGPLITVPAPFAQLDWPNPTLRVNRQTPFQIGSSLTLIEGVGEKPFAQHDWPNPTLRVNRQTPFQVGSSLTLIETAGEKPFAQLDWITPPPSPTVQLEQKVSLLPLTVAAVGQTIGGTAGEIASLEAFETDHIIALSTPQAITGTPGDIASAEAFETDNAISLSAHQEISGTVGDIASAEAFETDHVVSDVVLEILAAGDIASAESVGIPVIAFEGAETLKPKRPLGIGLSVGIR